MRGSRKRTHGYGHRHIRMY